MYSNLARSAGGPANAYATETVTDDDLKGLAKMIAQRHLHKGDQRAHPSKIHRFVQTLMLDHPYDLFGMLLVDAKQRMIAFEELGCGHPGISSHHPRELVKRVLQHNAAGVVLVHNLPFGDPEPGADIRLSTQRLQNALGIMDIRTVDHVIIGEQRHVSFVERGWL